MYRIILIVVIFLVVYFVLSAFKLHSQSNQGYKKITFKQMYSMIDDLDKDYTVLDVRTDAEYKEGRVSDSILIPDYNINDIESHNIDKDSYVFVYCRSGNRSKKATIKLLNMGYKNVYDVGGIIYYPYDLQV